MDLIGPVISVSLSVSLVSTAISLVLSLILAVLIVRKKYLFIKIIELIFYLPLGMPPVAVGYALLLLLGPTSAIGSILQRYFDFTIAFHFVGAVIASIVVSLGIGLRTIRLALERIDPQQW